jgi:glycosyltransferase involved in cell wall biosynthesis
MVRSVLRGKGWPLRDRQHHHTEPGVDLRIIGRNDKVTADDVPDSDVVIATWWETAEWVAKFPAEKGVKIYFIQHYEAFEHLPTDRVDATWRLPMTKVVVAQWLAELARDRFGDRLATVVPNAVDHNLFHAQPRGRQLIPTVGLMYSSVPFKGATIAAEAIRKASNLLPGLRVKAFGMESLADGLLPTGTEYYFSPPQDRIRHVYASCDAWLCASLSEGFGLPILEAMACRTPVIGTPTGAASELITGGGGYLVRMGDPDDMAAAIHRICTLPDADWRAISDAAFSTAAQYSWENATDKFEAALATAAASRG